MSIFGVHGGGVMLFDEMQPKIVKYVPSGVKLNGNALKIEKNAKNHTFWEFRSLSGDLMGMIRRK